MNPAMEPFPIRQRQVHAVIEAVGGYWRPAAGVLRLMEELGEFVERLSEGANDEQSRNALAEELADLWIITACTANQFLINLEGLRIDEHSTPVGDDGIVRRLIIHAGRIARIVNYYDGPKSPKSMEVLPPLRNAIASFQAHLENLAQHQGVALDPAVVQKLQKSSSRDAGRFQSSYDPSTSEAIGDFSSILDKVPSRFARQARLWGAPIWPARLSPEQYARQQLCDPLAMFAKAAAREDLDGFVISRPIDEPVTIIDQVDAWLSRLLRAIVMTDPTLGTQVFDFSNKTSLQFSYCAVRMTAMVFSDIYPDDHPRNSGKGTYVLLQPEASFASHEIGSVSEKSSSVNSSILHHGLIREPSAPPK